MSTRISPGTGFLISAEGGLGVASEHRTSCGPEGWTETLEADISIRYNGSHPILVRVHDATGGSVFEKT